MSEKAEISLDETADAVFCRPLAKPLAKLFAKTPATPNQVTLLGAITGIAGGLCLATPGYWPILGAALVLLMMVLDCTDGELARIRGGGTWRGRMIDGYADMTSTIAFHAGMCFYLDRVGIEVAGYHLSTLEIWLLAAAAGYSFIWNSGVVDAVKSSLKPGAVDHEMEKHANDVHGLSDRFLYYSLKKYVIHLRRSAAKLGSTDALLFQRVQRVGPTAHHLWMATAAVFAVIWPSSYLVFFFVAVVPANLYLAGILWIGRSQSETSQAQSDAWTSPRQ